MTLLRVSDSVAEQLPVYIAIIIRQRAQRRMKTVSMSSG